MEASAHSQRTFNETLAYGHQSEITNMKRRGRIRAGNRSGRKLFMFKGSATKRSSENPITATSTATVKQRRTPRVATSLDSAPVVRRDVVAAALAVADVESSTKRDRSASSTRNNRAISSTRRLRSRSAIRSSVAGNLPGSRNSSAASVGDVAPDEDTVAVDSSLRDEKNETEKFLVPAANNPTPLKMEVSKLVLSPYSASGDDSVDNDSVDDDEDGSNDEDEEISPNVTIHVPTSPTIVGHRKLVYNESKDCWVEYWKVEEDWKKARQRQKREAIKARVARELANAIPIPARKVKGRNTPRLQVMFPTAIVRGDRKHGFAHNINLTDPLRIELHKRRAPIVPTYFQQHILQYGKLPFRNNPRPHPVV